MVKSLAGDSTIVTAMAPSTDETMMLEAMIVDGCTEISRILIEASGLIRQVSSNQPNTPLSPELANAASILIQVMNDTSAIETGLAEIMDLHSESLERIREARSLHDQVLQQLSLANGFLETVRKSLAH